MRTSPISKINRSSYLLISFTIILIFFSLISQYFQSATRPNLEKIIQEGPFPTSLFENIQQINISSQAGNFLLNQTREKRALNNSNEEDASWELIAPSSLPANSTTVNELLKAMKKIKVKKVYLADIINLTNFSLHNPQLTILFRPKKAFPVKGRELDSISLSIGGFNSIDRSFYILTNIKNYIYQVEELPWPLMALNFSSLVNSRPFSINKDIIHSLALQTKFPRRASTHLQIIKDQENWTSPSKRRLGQDKVNMFIQKILSIKAKIILDKLSDQSNKIIDSGLRNPMVSLTLRDTNNNKIQYKMGLLQKKIPEIKGNPKSFLLIKASNHQFSYVIDSGYLNLFKTTERNLR